ncbi:hypothetical protein GCM10023321_04730 [Pseudonocardia eucalypti]|uniref:Thioredoxin domain-containing protein n=1 Tax=Pseudonocardia eucalypti TaxID=648755 RepID=A0ABP9PGA9_9PSEU|nr:thiol-disulfide isomerase/thioredoxin [Pseudonocardia eucalypti]
MTQRTGLTRGEWLTGGIVVALGAAAVIALWPSSDTAGPGGGPGSEPPPPPPVAWDSAELSAARRAAGLPACPSADAGGGAPAADTPVPGARPAGPLAGVRVPCLGAPGEVEPAAGLAGRDAVLNVWASWCAPCREELPALSEYAGRPGAVVVLGVDARRDRPEAALALLADLGVRLPVVADPDGALAAALRMPPALPSSYLLHADGRVTRLEPPTPFRTADEVAAAVDRARTAGR